MRPRTLALLVVLLVSGCLSATPAIHGEADLQHVLRNCGMIGQIDLEFVGPDQVTAVMLREDADDKGFMCVLRGLEARGLKFGFVGKG